MPASLRRRRGTVSLPDGGFVWWPIGVGVGAAALAAVAVDGRRAPPDSARGIGRVNRVLGAVIVGAVLVATTGAGYAVATDPADAEPVLGPRTRDRARRDRLQRVRARRPAGRAGYDGAVRRGQPRPDQARVRRRRLIRSHPPRARAPRRAIRPCRARCRSTREATGVTFYEFDPARVIPLRVPPARATSSTAWKVSSR